MIVVDVAAVVDALTAAEGTGDLRARPATGELHAPTLPGVEFVSTLRELVLGGSLSSARVEDALTDFEDRPILRRPAGDTLRRRTFDLRDILSAYDAPYVALAEALVGPLITRDARLARRPGHDARIEVC